MVCICNLSDTRSPSSLYKWSIPLQDKHRVWAPSEGNNAQHRLSPPMSPIALALLLGSLVLARLVNVTIDDTRGDERTGRMPEYTSVNHWNARNASTQCPTCGARPDGTQAFDQTWHDETTFPGQIPSNVSFSFNGTILYIYCILADNFDVTVEHKDTRLAFYLDHSPEPIKQFHHAPDLTVYGFIYNQLVFKDDTLSAGEHTMLVSNWADGESGSLVLFDYAIYSTEEADDSATSDSESDPPAPQTSGAPITPPGGGSHDNDPSRINVGAVVGGSVGGTVAVILLVATACWAYVHRRRRRNAEAFIPDVSAFMAAAPRSAEAVSAAADPFNKPHEKMRLESSNAAALSSAHTAPSADESAQFRSELEQMRNELERVRRLAEPPQYSHNRTSGSS